MLAESWCNALVKVFAVLPDVSSRSCMASRRVSATFRRGAAAYGVAFWRSEEARTHGCLLILR